MYLVVRLLVRLSRGSSSPSTHPERLPSKRDVTSRVTALREQVVQLIARGLLEMPDDTSRRSDELKLTPTGSSIFVAIAGSGTDDPLVLKFADSVVASVELATSSNVQQQLAADARLASWAHYVPRVLASGLIGATTFVIEQCLSRRDGRAVAGDPKATGRPHRETRFE